ncbi:class I SAM-dependent methyltransferase [Histidinibacterium lentulum]|uniref:Class I SAM-dependent methyltransferase n=1 Tax=Histidinibacterium lentulum TaxID=2480588 RepID=A0A3N2R6E4_9RHOB|nr:class I SAM-dependent methyltransferase [Histidinibacterium lentulum]ROU02978.1 class I SAM-dependent methyltransferase [Histidinibacterium lentulum]
MTMTSDDLPATIATLLERPYMELSGPERKALRSHFDGNAYSRRFDWNWREIHMNRIAAINRIVDTLPGDAAYLEIGCDANTLFDAVPLADKTGVDPARGGTHRMTSDEFFGQNDRKFDLIWIDGLHEYHQVHRDVENALAALKPGGWIGLHDMLPLDWLQEHMPRIHPGWTGDVWKVAFEIVATPGLEFRMVTIDHGVGLLRSAEGAAPLAYMPDTLSDVRFGYLYENIGQLQLVDWAGAEHWIAGGAPASARAEAPRAVAAPAGLAPAKAPVPAAPPAPEPPRAQDGFLSRLKRRLRKEPGPAPVSKPPEPETGDLLSRPFEDLTEEERKTLRKAYAANRDTRKFPWKWRQTHFNRVALMNHVRRTLPADAAYLEIGCGSNALFDSVALTDKTGVDPFKGGTVRLTSDEFFAQNDRKFDLIWIDGLHEYHQVHRDVENALAALKPGGWIGLHDMLPLDWLQEHMPRIHLGWTGDVWKVAFEIAATRGLDLRVLTIDQGVAILRAGDGHAPLADLSAELSDKRFGYLYDNIGGLPVASWEEGTAWIDGQAGR